MNSTLSVITSADTASIDRIYRYSLAGYFLVAVVLSLLMLLGLALMFCFEKHCCKHLVYLTCFFFGVFFILYLMGALLFGILAPASFVLCEGYNNLFNNVTALNQLMSGLGSVEATTMISSCIGGGSLIEGSTFGSSFTNIDSVTANSQNF